MHLCHSGGEIEVNYKPVEMVEVVESILPSSFHPYLMLSPLQRLPLKPLPLLPVAAPSCD